MEESIAHVSKVLTQQDITGCEEEAEFIANKSIHTIIKIESVEDQCNGDNPINWFNKATVANKD